MTTPRPDATIVIVTRDRRDQLRDALASALAQEGRIEVLVVDDGSRDDTMVMVQTEFPAARAVRFDEAAGLVVRRNDAARMARGSILVSIDDDAVFTTPHIVATTIEEFGHPRVAAVAIPFVDVHYGPRERQRAPDAERVWVTSTFRGTAHALRRDVFLTLSGYRAMIVHQGEEPDLTMRMLARGYVVRLGNADPIHHLESPSRNLKRMTLYGRRNELLLAFTYMRLPWNAIYALRWSLKGLAIGVRGKRLRDTLRGLAWGVDVCWHLRHERQPVGRGVLALDRRLRSSPVALDEIEDRLPTPSG